MSMGKSNCRGRCGTKTAASKGYCRACWTKVCRGEERAVREGILVDFAGDAAWAWDRLGNVLAGPADTKGLIWMALT